MKKIIALLIFVLLLIGCGDRANSPSSSLELSSKSNEEFNNKKEEAREISKLIPSYVQENNLPYITWDEVEEASFYKILIDLNSQGYPYYERSKDRKVAVFPGENTLYQIIPIGADGKEMTEYISDPLEVSYTIKEGFGGVEPWQRPDGYDSHRGAKEFPQGIYWSSSLAEEIKTWMQKTYSSNYLLWGHIAEIDPQTDRWIAPISPDRRLEPEYFGKGLDCVGFVNGFYYLYTMAFAGQDYRVMNLNMDETYGVYGSPYTPLGDIAYMPHIVIKPSLEGNYADEFHIRPGDINESDDHAWIVSDEGEGFESKIWEYEYINGFSAERSIKDLNDDSPDNPHDYWISGIANPLESYSKITIVARDEEEKPIEGGGYRLIDLFGRSMALEDKGGQVELYRPGGEEFFYLLFIKGEANGFYDQESFFTLAGKETILSRVIGGRYILEELEAPQGYKNLKPISFTIVPGEEKIINLQYEKK